MVTLFVRLLGLVNGLGLIFYGSKLLATMTRRFMSTDFEFTRLLQFLLGPPQLVVESIIAVGILFILGLTFRIRLCLIILTIIAILYLVPVLVALAFGIRVHSGITLVYLTVNVVALVLLSSNKLRRYAHLNE